MRRALAEGCGSRSRALHFAVAAFDLLESRRKLLALDAREREAWFEAQLGLAELLGSDELPEDSEELPRGSVPYLPCSLDTLLVALEAAAVGPTDIFVDVGSGLGRAALFAHWVTGARAIGVEIQGHLVRVSQRAVARLGLEAAVRFCQADATQPCQALTEGTVYFFYCPFDARRMSAALENLRPLAQTRRLRLCLVDMPFPQEPWLELVSDVPQGSLQVFATRPHPGPSAVSRLGR